MMTTRLVVFSLPLLLTVALADLTPTAPGPGQTFNAGNKCTIQWQIDESGTWTNVTIDLKSGSNANQNIVTNVASGLDGTDPSLTPFSWTCPEVDPHSAIYFYEFTNNGDTSTAKWTTRFTIASPTGNSVTPSNPTQPNGDSIPWGFGHLANVDAESDKSDPGTASIGGTQDDSGRDIIDDGDGDNREDPSDSDSGSGDSHSDDTKDNPADKDTPASTRRGGAKSTPSTAASSSHVSSSSDTGDDRSEGNTEPDASNSTPANPTSSPIKDAKSTKSASQASAAADSSGVPHVKAVSASGSQSTATFNPVKAAPTPNLPSPQKAHASAAAVPSATPTTSCQCTGSEKSGLTLTSGSIEREKVSGWVLLYPLFVMLLVMY